MAIGFKKGICLSVVGIISICLIICLFFMIRAYLRFNRYEGYKEGLEKQFLFDANQLRDQLTTDELDHSICRVFSRRNGQKVTLPQEQTIHAREVLLSVLACERMRPSFLRFSKHHVGSMGKIDLFLTMEDAERNRDAVVSINYYEYPNAVRISAAKRFNICDIEILLDEKTHNEVKELIEMATSPKNNLISNTNADDPANSSSSNIIESRRVLTNEQVLKEMRDRKRDTRRGSTDGGRKGDK